MYSENLAGGVLGVLVAGEVVARGDLRVLVWVRKHPSLLRVVAGEFVLLRREVGRRRRIVAL